MTRTELIEALAAELEHVPGVAVNFTQPMAMRLDEVVSGVKADVALKIYGEDHPMTESARALKGEVLADMKQVDHVEGSTDARDEITREEAARMIRETEADTRDP